jgi:hypothetical protein
MMIQCGFCGFIVMLLPEVFNSKDALVLKNLETIHFVHRYFSLDDERSSIFLQKQ